MKETAADRLTRLNLTVEREARLESLEIAHEIGVSDKTFAILANATRLYKRDTMVLPPQYLEGLSRGRGWARKGTGRNVIWGERVDGGYEVGPGRWDVGGTDGYRRKSNTVWTVEHITVGDKTWTIAN